MTNTGQDVPDAGAGIRGHSAKATILIVDDEPYILSGSSLIIRSEGLGDVLAIQDPREAMPALRGNLVSLVVLDLSMPHVSGVELLDLISAEFPDLPVVVMTATNQVDVAVECMRKGAYDYLVKPVTRERFSTTVRRALEHAELKNQIFSLRDHLLDDQLEHEEAFRGIVTRSKNMRAVFHYLESIANSRNAILIEGETGVGKELVARAAHEVSGCPGEFVPVNVAGVDDHVFSDTLFGHVRGAFTGADTARDGIVARAAGGSLLLDEIGDLAEASQVKLLRLLQERKYYPLGSDAIRSCEARVIVATNSRIQESVKAGKFRKDLYYRLCIHRVSVPPLRERVGDIPLLLDHFIEKAAVALGRKAPRYPEQIIHLLEAYPFPGNVRELEGMVHDAVAGTRSGVLSLDSFRRNMEGYDLRLVRETRPAQGPDGNGIWASRTRLPRLRDAEQELIDEALRRAQGNQGVAASMLGISRQALNARLIRKKRKTKQED